MADLIPAKTVAKDYLFISPDHLAKSRCTGMLGARPTPAFYKIGRSVFYDRDELQAWIEAGRRRSTSDKAAA